MHTTNIVHFRWVHVLRKSANVIYQIPTLYAYGKAYATDHEMTSETQVKDAPAVCIGFALSIIVAAKSF